MEIITTPEVIDLMAIQGNYQKIIQTEEGKIPNPETKESFVLKMFEHFRDDCVVAAKRSVKNKIADEEIATEVAIIKADILSVKPVVEK